MSFSKFLKLGALGISVLVLKNHQNSFPNKYQLPPKISPFTINAEELKSPHIKHKNKECILGESKNLKDYLIFLLFISFDFI